MVKGNGVEMEFNFNDLDYETNNLSHNEKQALETLFSSGQYRMIHEDGLTFFEIEGKKILRNQVQNFYNLQQYKPVPPCTFKPHQEKDRLESGLTLENIVQRALTHAEIDYKGNPLNRHYAHSQGQIVDIETEHMLIECTNPKRSTHLNKHDIEEKLNYYSRKDPEHKKHWILIISYIQCIDKEIRQRLAQQNITTLILNSRIHKRNRKVNYHLKIAPILTQLNSIATNNTNTLIETIESVNHSLMIRNTKPVYLLSFIDTLSSEYSCGCTFSPNNNECLSYG